MLLNHLCASESPKISNGIKVLLILLQTYNELSGNGVSGVRVAHTSFVTMFFLRKLEKNKRPTVLTNKTVI